MRAGKKAVFEARFFQPGTARLAGARSDLHRRAAARRLDPDRTDSCQPLAGRRHHGAARCSAVVAVLLGRADRGPRAERRAIPTYWPKCRPRSWPSSARITSPDPGSAQDRQAVLHRQDAEQFSACRPDPADPAEGPDHRRAPPSARLLLFGFKQHFARGQTFSYELADIGRYYRDYVELMAHFDGPAGHVHRVHYEALVADTETRGAPAARFCGLRFEPRCLRLLQTTGGANRELRTGPPAHLSRRARPLAPFRAMARTAKAHARHRARSISRWYQIALTIDAVRILWALGSGLNTTGGRIHDSKPAAEIAGY